MNRLFAAILLTISIVTHSQECVSLVDDVKIMGVFDRVNVDLDDVDPVTLPVVFHIIHKGASDETNISDEQILSQMSALDTGFRWGPGVDTKIQFCLAARDPEGNPTNGITRHNGAVLFGEEYVQEGVAASASKAGSMTK